MTTKPFTYQPLLAPDAIRLLLLDPARDDDASLHGTLLHTTLADCDYELIEPYTALSYVWGDSKQIEIICLSGQTVKITTTLASALRHLRDGARLRRIWADALCIDQSNIPERNRQVTLMGAVYSLAAHTVIYLGPSTKESDLVLGSAPRSLLGIYPSLEPGKRDAILQDAKFDILTRPWFRRVWVFQELILSRDPWVQCGHLRTRWTDLCSLLLHHRAGPQIKGDDKLQMLESMNRSRQGMNAGKMLSLLQARRGLGATDARDFVYAHMGIASDRESVGSAVSIDYNLAIGIVFTRMAFYIVKSESVDTLISLLDQQSEGAKRPGLPSWAVDWSVPSSEMGSMYVDNLVTRAKLVSAPTVCVENDSLLGLVGHSVGVIVNLSVPLPWSTTLDLKGMLKYQDTVSKISALYNSTGGVYYTGDSEGRHARVSLRNHEQEHKELCVSLFHEWKAFLQTLSPGAADAPGEHAAFLRCFSAWAEEQTVNRRVFVTRESSDLLRIMWEYLHPSIAISSLDGRRLATTLAGSVGVVPAHAQAGDHVVNVMGCQVPLVLRPVQDSARIDQSLRSGIQALQAGLATGDATDNRETGFMKGVPSMTHVSPLQHYMLVGSCCFDGQVPWAVSQLPKDEGEMIICGLH